MFVISCFWFRVSVTGFLFSENFPGSLLSNQKYLMSYSYKLEPVSLKEEQKQKYDIYSFFVLNA
jgi:hypothetical protein